MLRGEPLLLDAKHDLPRIRGGASNSTSDKMPDDLSSPHTRGCFLLRNFNLLLVVIFPAYAGVLPTFSGRPRQVRNLPRIRGGASRLNQ